MQLLNVLLMHNGLQKILSNRIEEPEMSLRDLPYDYPIMSTLTTVIDSIAHSSVNRKS